MMIGNEQLRVFIAYVDLNTAPLLQLFTLTPLFNQSVPEMSEEFCNRVVVVERRLATAAVVVVLCKMVLTCHFNILLTSL